MVKYGYCKLSCSRCHAGIAVKTNIQRDNGWELQIVSTKCEHFEFWCDLFTNDSFNPYRDEIQLKTYSMCSLCGQTCSEHIACVGFDNKEKSVWKECHGNTACHELKLYSNTSSDYAVNTILYSFGLYGTLAKFISKKIGDHLELYEFKDGHCLEVELPDDESEVDQ